MPESLGRRQKLQLAEESREYAAALQAEGNSERAMQAYEAAMQLQPSSDLARSNRDKLPISQAYRQAASYESSVLASRAARAAALSEASLARANVPQGANEHGTPRG